MASKNKEDEYRFAFELHTGKAHIVVYEPILTKEEQECRIQELRNATRSFMRSYYRNKERNRSKGESRSV